MRTKIILTSLNNHLRPDEEYDGNYLGALLYRFKEFELNWGAVVLRLDESS